MGRTFRGEFTQKVDGKGRVSIPVDFRRELELGDPGWSAGNAPQFVLVYGTYRRGFHECYTMEAAEKVDARIEAMPRASTARKNLQTLFHGFSLKLTVDDTGRIVLPQKQRDLLGLTDQAYFLAAGDTFQIWRPETFAEERAPALDQWLDQKADDFDVMSYLDEEPE